MLPSMKECVFVNSALKYTAKLSKIDSYRLLFRRFCPLSKYINFISFYLFLKFSKSFLLIISWKKILSKMTND